jgi:hypothetical protein
MTATGETALVVQPGQFAGRTHQKRGFSRGFLANAKGRGHANSFLLA